MYKPDVLWEITHKCNAKCIHCISDAGGDRHQELSTEEALDLCDQLAEFANRIHLLGGEVFLRSDWKKIVERIHSHGIPFSIVTNGLALKEETINFLKEMEIYNLGLSLDGGKAETHDHIRGVPGIYQRNLDLMEKLAEEEVSFSVISTFNKLNILEAKLLLGTMMNSPNQSWQVQIASAHGRMSRDISLDAFEYYVLGLFLSIAKMRIPDEVLTIVAGHDLGHYSGTIPNFSAQPDWDGCHAGKYTFGICSNGDIHGCLCMMSAEEFVLGNVRNKPLREYWEAVNFCPWNFGKIKALTGYCAECCYSTKCLAGCSDTAHALTGSIGENPLCYHRIEGEWMHRVPQDDQEWILRELTTGRVDERGNIYLGSGGLLTTSLISQLSLEPARQELLKLIACV
ncbi:MAG TPA: hypothetical protein DD435_04875 [Cyanobacteria bacterium UBA8530]|nr:hypothetical protein [Cyanobacteria bacterium UBA8530]